eukprot:6188951-Pleurochrysis_carterae.AAC.1
MVRDARCLRNEPLSQCRGRERTVRAAWVTMPEKAIMASRPLAISFSSITLSDLMFSGLNLYSPGPAASGSFSSWKTFGVPPTISKTLATRSRNHIGPLSTVASCAAREDTCGASGAVMPKSTASQPAVASMARRQHAQVSTSETTCLYAETTASVPRVPVRMHIRRTSRAHFSGIKLLSMSGSKPTSPAKVPSRAGGWFRKGMAFDLACARRTDVSCISMRKSSAYLASKRFMGSFFNYKLSPISKKHELLTATRLLKNSVVSIHHSNACSQSTETIQTENDEPSAARLHSDTRHPRGGVRRGQLRCEASGILGEENRGEHLAELIGAAGYSRGGELRTRFGEDWRHARSWLPHAWSTKCHKCTFDETESILASYVFLCLDTVTH